MPTNAPVTGTLEYIPSYPDVSGGDRIGAISRIDGALIPVIVNNIEYLRRLIRVGTGASIPDTGTDWTQEIEDLQAAVSALQSDLGVLQSDLNTIQSTVGQLQTDVVYLKDAPVINVTPTGTINGINMTFAVPDSYKTGTLRVSVNGLETFNFSIAASSFTFTDYAPVSGDIIRASYLKEE